MDRFNEGVAQGHLLHLVPLQHANAGGEYDRKNKTIALPLIDLTTAPATGPRRYSEGSMIFVLGHELEHGFNSADKLQAQAAFQQEAHRKAKSPPPHDYTVELGKMLAFNRRDEAEAEIAGWNAVISAAKNTNRNPTLQDIFDQSPGRMRDFIDQKGNFPNFSYTLKSNLTISPDSTIDPSLPSNVEAMGQNYFDKPPRQAGLGPHAQSDYANYYGAYAISVVGYAERYSAKQSAPIVLDLAKLGLNEKLLEENGLDLSAQGRTMPYLDVGTTPGKPARFDHTKDMNQHVPITTPASPTLVVARSPDDPSHPDHAMLQSIRNGVRKIDEGIGKPYDDVSERISRSLLAACKDNRDAFPGASNYSLAGNALSRVDHVALGTNGVNVFAIEGRLDDPAHKRCHVSTHEAIQTPVEQSDQKLQAAHLAIAQEQQQPQQQQALSQQVDAPSRGGMSR